MTKEFNKGAVFLEYLIKVSIKNIARDFKGGRLGGREISNWQI